MKTFVDRDVIFDSDNQGSDTQGTSMGAWAIIFNLKETLEVKFTKRDRFNFSGFIVGLEMDDDNV